MERCLDHGKMLLRVEKGSSHLHFEIFPYFIAIQQLESLGKTSDRFAGALSQK